MMYYDDIDILRGAYIYQHFDEKVISDMIEALNQRSFNILISDTKHETYSKKEKNFGAEYEEKDFPEEYQKLWDERKVNPGFHLVKENTFKATDFEIFVNEEESPVSWLLILIFEFIKLHSVTYLDLTIPVYLCRIPLLYSDFQPSFHRTLRKMIRI